jgi:hypothetical protein
MYLEHSDIFDCEPWLVHQQMCDEQFQREKAQLVGATDFEMSTREFAGGLEVETRRRMETLHFPEFVKSMVRPTIVVTEKELWRHVGEDSCRGSFTLEIKGAPVKFFGDVEIERVPSGTMLRFSGELKSTIPLFAAQIEQASSGAIYETMRKECALLHDRAHLWRHAADDRTV